MIFKLHLLGWTSPEIEKVVGLDDSSIRGIVENFNIKLFNAEYKSGLTRETVGMTVDGVYAIRKKFNVKLFTDEFKSGL